MVSYNVPTQDECLQSWSFYQPAGDMFNTVIAYIIIAQI